MDDDADEKKEMIKENEQNNNQHDNDDTQKIQNIRKTNKNDILIYSETLEEHLKDVETIMKELDRAGLKLNLDKCIFCTKEAKFLGYVVNGEGVKIDKERLEEIKGYRRPHNLKTLRGFLGILNYYKKFVTNLSEKAAPLYELLKKGKRWSWGEKEKNAFESLKQSFYANLVLKHPDFNKKFILRTDASDIAISGELVQVEDGLYVPICFISRILKGYEARYSIVEKEMLAIVFSLEKLKYYLAGNKFELQTDNIALTHMTKSRFTNSRLYRWSILIQEYDFNITHRRGTNNITADSLTRKDVQEMVKFIRIMSHNIHAEWDQYLKIIEKYINNVPNVVTEQTPMSHNIHAEWDQYLKIIEKYINNVPNVVTEQTPKYLLTRESSERPWAIIEKYINNVPNVVTEQTPKYLLTRESSERPWAIDEVTYTEDMENVRKKLKKYWARQKERMDKKIKKKVTFNIGDLVVTKNLQVAKGSRDICAKLVLPYKGPYVVKCIMGNNYELAEIDTNRNIGKYNIKQVYKYIDKRYRYNQISINYEQS
ncbi:RNase H-like domain found in reverse transcriptase [Popillia japonica]|uniref:RNA-directed DNA polymerase n=1 Tax=Popillia japonica TaxID=7064 RepID=A0AAW1JFX4_POPJA